MAYFTDVYTPRSYKRKIFGSLAEAEAVFEEAKEYYSSYMHLDRVEIESRNVSEWRAEEL